MLQFLYLFRYGCQFLSLKQNVLLFLVLLTSIEKSAFVKPKIVIYRPVSETLQTGP